VTDAISSLIQAVVADPNDDTARLVLADAIDESGRDAALLRKPGIWRAVKVLKSEFGTALVWAGGNGSFVVGLTGCHVYCSSCRRRAFSSSERHYEFRSGTWLCDKCLHTGDAVIRVHAAAITYPERDQYHWCNSCGLLYYTWTNDDGSDDWDHADEICSGCMIGEDT
jgi:uncharacterized protein (TIGR02996 family)